MFISVRTLTGENRSDSLLQERCEFVYLKFPTSGSHGALGKDGEDLSSALRPDICYGVVSFLFSTVRWILFEPYAKSKARVEPVIKLNAHPNR